MRKGELIGRRFEEVLATDKFISKKNPNPFSKFIGREDDKFAGREKVREDLDLSVLRSLSPNIKLEGAFRKKSRPDSDRLFYIGLDGRNYSDYESMLAANRAFVVEKMSWRSPRLK